MAIILKVNTKSRQSVQVILVLILNKALKMIVKQGLMLHSWEGHCQSVEELQCFIFRVKQAKEERMKMDAL